MPSRRQVLATFALSFLFAGCGESGEGEKVSAPPTTPEQKAQADDMKAALLKKMKKH